MVAKKPAIKQSLVGPHVRVYDYNVQLCMINVPHDMVEWEQNHVRQPLTCSSTLISLS